MSEWIDVNDRLPEKTGYYIGFVSGGSQEVLFGNGDVWHNSSCSWNDIPVTHWMPLPEPPKEQSDE